MYTEQDMLQAQKALHRDYLISGIVWALCIGTFITGVCLQTKWISYVGAGLLFISMFFAFSMYIWPHTKYRRFLRDMQKGLTRTIAGTIDSISAETEIQDGAEVYAVQITLADEDDSRILYISADKAQYMPAVGSTVKAACYGRHIRGFEE